MTLPSGTRSSRVKANVMHRQALKKKWDRHCRYESSEDLPKSFSTDGTIYVIESQEDKSSENWTRLLDEGVVVDGDGYAYAVIRKGTLKKFYDNIPSNFVGYINKDHISAIGLGKFTKSDLRLVEISNDRYALDVNVKLDDDLYAVKDLKRENNRNALSAEFFANVDEYATAEKVTGDPKQGKWLVPLIDDLKLEGYAVCENPKNANSYDESLLEKAANTKVTEEFNMDEDEAKKALETEAEVETETTEDKTEEVETTTEEDVEEVEDAEQASADESEESEETEVEETEVEEDSEESTEEEAETPDEGEDKLSAVEQKIEQLTAEITSLKEENAELKTKLSAKAQKEEQFEERLSSILSMASSDEPSADEGGATPDKEKDNKDEVVDAYKAAIADLNKE